MKKKPHKMFLSLILSLRPPRNKSKVILKQLEYTELKNVILLIYSKIKNSSMICTFPICELHIIKLCLQIEAFLKVSTKKKFKKISGIFH